MVVCIALDVGWFGGVDLEGVSARPYIVWRDWVIVILATSSGVLPEYYLGSFLLFRLLLLVAE
jgi:hypothetical protein